MKPFGHVDVALGEPHDLALEGDPFDGSSIRMAINILEMPPKRITFEWFPDSSRGAVIEAYDLSSQLTEEKGWFAYVYATKQK